MKWELQKDQLGRLNDIGLLTVEGEPGIYQNALSVTALWDDVELTVMKDIQVSSTPEEGDYLKVHALPQRFFLEPREDLKLNAVALNGLGKIAVGTELRWEMVNKFAGTIDGNGNFIAGNDPGVYTEAVRVEAVMPGEVGFVRAEDFASVVIRYRELTRLSNVSAKPSTIVLSPKIQPFQPSVSTGKTIRFTLKGWDTNDILLNNLVVKWSVADQKAGTIDALGNFRAGETPGLYTNVIRAEIVQQIPDRN